MKFKVFDKSILTHNSIILPVCENLLTKPLAVVKKFLNYTSYNVITNSYMTVNAANFGFTSISTWAKVFSYSL